ncbi:cytochrome C [Pollutimonas subterranea]|uniref:Cytochrome C n=1 Tax=Pollutimonas subterranea TaxID=2045210 RepID=A0A2N4U771_9BURK|nr:c-type cytochrome [Pollutimonas subterranea]PLC50870.1 cytochrome C [Pollutimonas subterranea]
MKDNKSSDKFETAKPQRMSGARRLAWAAGLGIVLFGVGYAIDSSGLLSFSFTSQKTGTTQIGNAVYTREAMESDRGTHSKDRTTPTASTPVGSDGYYLPPSEKSIPETPYGDAVRRGRAIFLETPSQVSDHVGNTLSCVNCHLDAGRRENSAPMWGAYVRYPAYRGKTKSISTLEDRITGCFTYSMNAQASPSGKPPAAGSDVYRDLMTYFYWMSDGAPTGEKMPGAGYPKVKKPEQGYDLIRGGKVYAQNCALCHSADGQGQRDSESGVVFPPLWGPDSYNWGAGMARIDTAAGFIKANMPLGKPFSLTDQEAWDVAAYLNSHERPKDPRQTGTLEEARLKFHKDEESYYGKEVSGKIVGGGVSHEQSLARAVERSD